MACSCTTSVIPIPSMGSLISSVIIYELRQRNSNKQITIKKEERPSEKQLSSTFHLQPDGHLCTQLLHWHQHEAPTINSHHLEHTGCVLLHLLFFERRLISSVFSEETGSPSNTTLIPG